MYAEFKGLPGSLPREICKCHLWLIKILWSVWKSWPCIYWCDSFVKIAEYFVCKTNITQIWDSPTHCSHLCLLFLETGNTSGLCLKFLPYWTRSTHLIRWILVLILSKRLKRVQTAALSFRRGAERDCWSVICIFQITIHAISWSLLSDYVWNLCLMQCTFPRAKNVTIDLVSTETMTCQNERHMRLQRPPAVFYARLRTPRSALEVGVNDNKI